MRARRGHVQTSTVFESSGKSHARAPLDNLSHSLIGLIAGETLARASHVRPESPLAPGARRGLLVAVSVVGNNLPDLDLLYSYRPFAHDTRAKLDYMLQHRGYTHTVLVCMALAMLLYGAVEIWARWKRVSLARHDRLVIAGAALFAVLLHLAMDFLNSYGVHPFWPWQDRWLYGDSVFIVEPLYWAAALPLFCTVRSKSARVILALAPVIALLLCLLTRMATPVWCAGYGLLAGAMLIVGARASASVAAFVSAGVAGAVTALFVVCSSLAAHRIDAIAAAVFTTDRVIDHVLTPAPLNPLCWDVLLLETREDRYFVRSGVLSISPALMPAQRCPSLSSARLASVLRPLPASLSGEIQWIGEFAMSRAQLSSLVASHCQAAALMQFARAPFAAELQHRWVMGDLRFERGRGAGMASIDPGPVSSGECRSPVPWTPPRADLLDLRR
jgi:inner membrane protein